MLPDAVSAGHANDTPATRPLCHCRWRPGDLASLHEQSYEGCYAVSRGQAAELTPSSSTRLLSCLRLRHMASSEAIAKPWTFSQPSSQHREVCS
jgi:hypothetical protein